MFHFFHSPFLATSSFLTSGTKVNSLNGKEVSVTFTKNGKWNNLVEGGIKGKGTTQETIPEETVEDPPKEAPKNEAPKTESTKTSESMQKVASYQNKADRVQVLIVRQNSWTQASNVVANLLKGVEVGVLAKKDVGNLTVQMVEKLAHDIEKDIMRE